MIDSDPVTEREALRLFERALELPDADRADWLERHSDLGSVLRARVFALVAGDLRASVRTGGFADAIVETIIDDRLPDQIGGYRIVARIGRGGMGTVYRGERTLGDFDHVAAIKVIKPGLLSERLVERFRRERQTLARLDHPHIARLFDGGETAGAPFIVMELVDGEPILDWCDGRKATLLARLRLFGDVCSAVSYAHRNLIVHRDIAPTNVLVTRPGVAKLIDFGIARPADDATRPNPAKTSVAALTVTPGYAAPERAIGAEATTLGDVYSLGKLLAALIEPAQPAARLRRELAAIVAKASSSEPAARYPSVDALAADVEACCSGTPVAAMAGGRRYVAAKFYSRHRASVVAGAAALAVLLVALAATLWALDRSRTARREAEARFTQTRAIAKTMIFDAYDAVSRTPGSTRARAILATSGLRYLDALAADPDAPYGVRLETGRGFARLADVIGSGATGTLGKLADATVLLDRARTILERAHAERPGDLEAVRALSALNVEHAHVALFVANDIARSHRDAAKALRLMHDDPRHDAEWAQIWAGALAAEGEALSWAEDWTGARRWYDASIDFVAKLPPKLRDDRKVARVAASTLRLLGEAQHKLGMKGAARATLDSAVARQEALLAADPGDPVQQRATAAANWYRAIVHRTNRRDAAALASITRAVDIATRMRDADPEDAAASHLWLLMAEVQAQTLLDNGNIPGTFAMNEAMMTGYRRLIALSPDAPGTRRSFTSALRTIGGSFYNGRSYPRACMAWREAGDILRQLVARKVATKADRGRQRELAGYVDKACHPPSAALGREL